MSSPGGYQEASILVHLVRLSLCDFGEITSPWPLFLLSKTKGFCWKDLRGLSLLRNQTPVPELSNSLLLRFGVCILNIGRNPEHSDMRKEETREAVRSPQPSVCSGVRAAEGVGKGGRTRRGRSSLSEHLTSQGKRS